MNTKIKIGNKTFEINFPFKINFPDEYNYFEQWWKLIESQKSNKDTWTEIPELPGYKFKNLRITQSPIETNSTNSDAIEISMNFNYDDLKLE